VAGADRRPSSATGVFVVAGVMLASPKSGSDRTKRSLPGSSVPRVGGDGLLAFVLFALAND
jgi:hypothetical protein